MKLTALLLTVSVLSVSARTVSQTISFSGKNVKLEKVFAAIKKQTGYSVTGKSEILFEGGTVSVDAHNMELDEFLSLVFRDKPYEFEIKSKTIFIRRKISSEKKDDINNDHLPLLFSPPIKGRVLADDGSPLSGASVVIRGKKISAFTDADGFFTINAEEGETLLVSYVGFANRQIQATSSIGTITLQKSESKLDEIQIIGYGTTTQRYSTGSVSKVNGEEIAKQPVANPLAGLQGRVPGLQIIQSSGVPGASFKVQIRGQNSLLPRTSGNKIFDNPLYIIDGVPFAPQNNYVNQLTSLAGNGTNSPIGSPGYSPFNSINPSSIESIEVLRDADATAIYGSRGANGVILITTKKGKSGKAKFNANVYKGASKVTKSMSLLNIEQHRNMRREAFENDGITPGTELYTEGYAPDLLIFDSTKNTDWTKEFMGETADVIDANASVSGGSETTYFFVGAGYHHETYLFPG
ncbi:MAG: TonB-dependent receptor plug domain-containing protein, partial [Chitinophagaceae bacterium]|nr:TonB-dependent receptor plug domain-containing protein [Chitinophagaceae bacterium]